MRVKSACVLFDASRDAAAISQGTHTSAADVTDALFAALSDADEDHA